MFKHFGLFASKDFSHSALQWSDMSVPDKLYSRQYWIKYLLFSFSFFLSSSFFFISECYSPISIVHFVQKFSLLISLETNLFIKKFFCNSIAGFLLKYIICLTMIFLNFCKGKYITLIKFVNFHTVISFKVVKINFRGLREHCHLQKGI